MRSGFGYTAVVGGVAAVGLVLAVLSFAGGSSDNTDQEIYPVLLAAGLESPDIMSVVGPPVGATTTTVVLHPAIPRSNLRPFCELADEFSAARQSVVVSGGGQSDWEKVLEFYSVGATLVSPRAVDPVTGDSWREILLTLSGRQSVVNLELAQVAWNLGAYHDAKSSSGVVEVPTIELVNRCGKGS